jgi:hypothetical protein
MFLNSLRPTKSRVRLQNLFGKPKRSRHRPFDHLLNHEVISRLTYVCVWPPDFKPERQSAASASVERVERVEMVSMEYSFGIEGRDRSVEWRANSPIAFKK